MDQQHGPFYRKNTTLTKLDGQADGGSGRSEERCALPPRIDANKSVLCTVHVSLNDGACCLCVLCAAPYKHNAMQKLQISAP